MNLLQSRAAASLLFPAGLCAWSLPVSLQRRMPMPGRPHDWRKVSGLRLRCLPEWCVCSSPGGLVVGGLMLLCAGVCMCDANYEGADCGQWTCRNAECIGTDACHRASNGSSVAECGGRGVCTDGECKCVDGYEPLTQCTVTGCVGDGMCSGHGTCVAGSCSCDSAHFGVVSDCCGLLAASLTRVFAAGL